MTDVQDPWARFQDVTQGNDADVWSQFQDAQAASPAVSEPQQGPSALVDSIRVLPGGVAQGAAGIAGLPREIGDLMDAGVRWAGNKIAPGAGDKAVAFNHRNSLRSVVGPLPATKAINDAISQPFGGYYLPKTKAGEYSQTVAQFLPSALLPGTLPQKVASVLVPAIASETAGQATKGTRFEPIARAGGALLGGIAQGTVQGMAAARANPAPTLEQIGTMKTAAYKAADDAGVVIAPERFQRFATDLGADLTKNNVIQGDVHKNALVALNILQDEAAAGVPISLARADAIRKAVNGAIGNAAKHNGDDLRIASKVKGAIDDFLNNLSPADTLSGDAGQAVAHLRNARGLAQREFKAEKIQELIDLAENAASSNYGQSGISQALRTQFKSLNAELIKNPTRAKAFTADERAAIQQLSRGGSAENALRWIGKFGGQSTIPAAVGAAIGGTLGSSLGGAAGTSGAVVGALGVPMLGAAAQKGSGMIARNNALQVRDLMLRGVALPKKTPSTTSLLSDLTLSQQGLHR